MDEGTPQGTRGKGGKGEGNVTETMDRQYGLSQKIDLDVDGRVPRGIPTRRSGRRRRKWRNDTRNDLPWESSKPLRDMHSPALGTQLLARAVPDDG